MARVLALFLALLASAAAFAPLAPAGLTRATTQTQLYGYGASRRCLFVCL